MTIDWQFVIVTVVALGAAAVVVRRFVPSRRRSSAAPARSAACDHCAPVEPKADGTRTTPVVSVGDLRATARKRR
jgi:hypothetical protein